MVEPSSGDAVKKDESRLPFDWLALKISAKTAPGGPPGRSPIFISVPKKIVALSTRRNRLRRLIREAVRQDAFFKEPGKEFFFRVMRCPDMKTLKLADVLKAVGCRKKELIL